MKKQNIRRFFVLPLCLLGLKVIELIIQYKARSLHNEYLATLVTMLLFLAGFGVVGGIISPAIEKTVEKSMLKGREAGGAAGVWLLGLCLFAGLFFVFHLIFTQGAQAILPASWR
jgi:hypothetical protein